MTDHDLAWLYTLSHCNIRSEAQTVPSGPKAHDTDVDLLVVGYDCGLATGLYAPSLDLKTLVVQANEYVGGSLSMSVGAF